MTKLSVNVNKIATLRNARGKNLPDLKQFGIDILRWGAHGLTVHPRPDGRHIRMDDVPVLSQVVRDHKADVEFNIEGYPSDDYLALIRDINPDQATLVPDPPEALTSNAGWLVQANQAFLSKVVKQLKGYGTRVSVFIDPQTCRREDLLSLKAMGVDRIELYTEAFADSFGQPHFASIVDAYRKTANLALESGLGLNAGHDLNQNNLQSLVTAIPEIAEVSIGHALITEALYQGLPQTIDTYLRILGWR